MTIGSFRDLTPQVDTHICVITHIDNKGKELYWGRACNIPDKILEKKVSYFYPMVSIDHKPYLVAVV